MNDGPTVTIDGVAYKIDDLSDNAKAILESMQFAEAEIRRAKGLIAVLETSKLAYQADLKNNLPPSSSDSITQGSEVN